MERVMYKGWNDEECLTGCLETVKWVSTTWSGGPKESGEYIVSDGNGNIKTMWCTGGNETGEGLFKGCLDQTFENAFFSNGVKLTSDDLIRMYQSYNVWYEVAENHYYDYYYDDLVVMTDEDKPKYFMEPKLRGPIDSEVDTYAKAYVDLDGKILE